jgi:hypothetical protein
MYETLEEFKQDIQISGNEHYKDILTNPKKIWVAHEIYLLTRRGTALNITIVGRVALEVRDSDEEYPSIDHYVKDNFGSLHEESRDIGSVLDTTNWSLLANDAWLLGSLHALTEFHFASPLRWGNMWDDKNQRMTITAREVIGIASAGYSIMRPNPKLEPVAVCNDRRMALAASLLTYNAHLSRYQKRDNTGTQIALKGFLATLPSNVG